MKKQILTLSLAVLVAFSSAFANGKEGVSQKAVESFSKEFVNAKNVQWESGKEFNRATFELNQQVMFAYYSADGDLLAVSRNITSNQLPIRLSADLKKQYGNFWISDLFEMASNNETSYYVTLESADQTIVLKAVGANAWELYKKEKKEVI